MKYYSEKLKLGFDLTEEGVALFEDGTTYKPDEMRLVQGLSGEDLKSVHFVKSLFEGEIIHREGVRK